MVVDGTLTFNGDTVIQLTAAAPTTGTPAAAVADVRCEAQLQFEMTVQAADGDDRDVVIVDTAAPARGVPLTAVPESAPLAGAPGLEMIDTDTDHAVCTTAAVYAPLAAACDTSEPLACRVAEAATGWVAIHLHAPAYLAAYSCVLAAGGFADRPHGEEEMLRDWEVEACPPQRDPANPASWCVIDTRRRVALRHGCTSTTVAVLARVRRPGWYAGVRLRVLATAGATGSMRGTTEHDTGSRLDAWRLWTVASAGPSPYVGLRVALSGPPGRRRLRLATSDRGLDVVSTAVLPHGSHGPYAIVVQAAVAASCGALTVALYVNGAPVALREAGRVVPECDDDDEAAAADAGVGVTVAYPAGAQWWMEASPLWCAVGGPAWRAPGVGADAVGDPAFAYDAPSYPTSMLAPFTGTLSAFGAFRNRIAPTGAPCPPSPYGSGTPRYRATPLCSMEHLLSWQPAPDADAALTAVPRLQPATPLPPPRRLIVHDCGPAVYREDADVRGAVGVPASGAGCADISEEGVVAQLPHSGGGDVSPPPRCPAVCDGAGFGYTFARWDCCDALVYFSHARVSIPPPGWVAAAHANGARVLGTIMTEWADGARANAVLSAAPERAAAALAALAHAYGFDGWLVNIEAGCDAVPMRAFLRALREEVTAALPLTGCVVWYDSVTWPRGTVAWQSRLNDANAPFFDAAGAIMLDYHWQPAWLTESAAAARAASGTAAGVAVGIDVWGRGTWGGGKYDCVNAVAAIRGACSSGSADDGGSGLSVALFAPAWTYETAMPRTSAAVADADARLWDGGEVAKTTHLAVANADGAGGVGVGWEVLDSGGDGWAVAEVGSDGAPPGGAPHCWVTSFGWCRSRQTVPVPATLWDDDADAVDVEVAEWVCGTGPDAADWYSLTVQLVGADGAPVPSRPDANNFTTGAMRTTATWQRVAAVFRAVTRAHGVAAIVIEHGGKDAEFWAGHYGARITGTSATATTVVAGAGGGGGGTGSGGGHTLAGLLRGMGTRPVLLSVPFATSFGVGRGAVRCRRGVVTSSEPWFDVGGVEAQAAAGCGGATVLGTAEAPAWQGGAYLVLASPGRRTLFPAALHLPPAGASLRLTLVWRPQHTGGAAAAAGDATAVTPFLVGGDGAAAVALHAAGSTHEAGWQLDVWAVHPCAAAECITAMGVTTTAPIALGAVTLTPTPELPPPPSS